MTELQQTALKLIHRIGAVHPTDILKDVKGLTAEDVQYLSRGGLIKASKAIPGLIEISTPGMRKIGINATKLTPPKTSKISDDHYDGAELRPYTGRPGCNDSLALPSRYMNQLHYRDGRSATL